MCNTKNPNIINALPRLQKIENNVKTVISIYEVVNNINKNDAFAKPKRQDLSLFRQIGFPKSEVPTTPDGSQSRPGSPEASLLKPTKKPSAVITQPYEGVYVCPSMLESNKWKLKKPGSAPSSFSALSTSCESNLTWQVSPKSSNKVLGKINLSKAKTSANLNTFIESESRVFKENELPMTPSKTLETANKILNKSNEDEAEDYEPISYIKTKKMENCGSSRVQEDFALDAKTNETPKENSIPDLEKIKKELKNQDAVAKKSPSAFVRKKNSFLNEMPDWLMSIKPKSLDETKLCANTKKDNKPFLNPVPVRSKTPEKILKPDIENFEGKTRTKVKSLQEKETKFDKCKIDQNEQATKENEETDNDAKFLEDAKAKILEKINPKAKQEKLGTDGMTDRKIIRESDKEKKIQSPPVSTCESQKIQDVDECEVEKTWASEFTKIIEKNHEKLEKMKVSKELALDMAKHLKDKYEEIQQSKQELMEKVQKMEKDNERLNNEVKEAQESKLTWQLKFMELKKDSRTRMTEQDTETKKIMEENSWLKSKLCELQQQCTKELLEKQKEIDRIQAERLEEMKQEISNRKNRTEVLRLTSENSRLLSKTETLQRLVNESHLQIKIQEEKIRQFEEEVQKQKQHLQEKTDRLEETNKELELIRRNYNDLEDQVKALRKNFENFDEMQQNLMKQILEYEQLMKNKQEQMKSLQNENLKLKDELENEKDSLLIKIKIIEDQQETIKQLREKSEEAKTLLKKNQSLERVINIEREEKLELQEAVERLKWRKEELKKKIKSLENDLFLAPQEVVRDLQKTQMVLHELESQVQKKQKEWEIQMQSLIKEKEQACSVAEFATKKLMQTTNEFQKQSEAHKKLRRTLAESLAEREKMHLENNGKN